MNKKDIIGIGFIALAALTAYYLVNPAGTEVVRCLGKASWYVPYVLLIGSIRCFKSA